jgi:hypothetical protein
MIPDSVRVSEYNRFYEDNKRNGLKYDVTIDSAIFDLLNNEKDSLNNRELKSKIENYIGHDVAFTTFRTHLNILVSHKILNRNDTGRGKEVLYSLTSGAKKLLKMNLLKQSSPDEILSRRIFEKLFFYLLHISPAKTISSEKEFEKFLMSEVNLSSKDLEWGRISTGSNYEIVEIIYDYCPHQKHCQKNKDLSCPNVLETIGRQENDNQEYKKISNLSVFQYLGILIFQLQRLSTGRLTNLLGLENILKIHT